ncbi:hypothetical protein BDZ89DRAFT_1063055 [Hymenopellis radicata]|nr:hypothetical protein BDZ89DRAFT_1063055 [Hymenopellis radicata]
MAQASSMGPPLSPRETRRSGRRSAHSGSTSTSKSPDSDPMPRPKDVPQRPSLPSNNSGGRGKRLKQEDVDDTVVDRKNGHSGSTTSSSSAQGAPTGRSRRKKKDKDEDIVPDDPPEDMVDDELAQDAADEDEEQSVTRCVCGSTEDDPDAGEFMVQCETCKVWQHGLCMGYESEDQLQFDDYYCELCKPELHADLFKRLSRKVRQSSTTSHHTVAAGNRMSRSHSPSHSRQQASKRRNTMNSRDAAFDENLKEILESTAHEADGTHDSKVDNDDEDMEPAPTGRRKRKRADDDAPAKKRTRSASVASEQRASSNIARSETPMPSAMKTPVLSAPPVRPSGRGKRGGGRKAAVLHSDVPVLNESGEVVSSAPKRGHGRGKGGGAKRGHALTAPASAAAESRRNLANGAGSAGQSHAEGSRAYRNSHAYVVSQQPLLTSWHLPDYLAHMENIFPTSTPAPLEVPSTGENGIELISERGVKTKWPGKRMSVIDMNKRVRALVEWVGREQASASERVRRREALEEALKQQALDENAMVVDGVRTQSPLPRPSSTAPFEKLGSATSSGKTMKLMEELMEELINFQERFGRRG